MLRRGADAACAEKPRQISKTRLVPLAGLEPALLAEPDFESGASTDSATGASGGIILDIAVTPYCVPIAPFPRIGIVSGYFSRASAEASATQGSTPAGIFARSRSRAAMTMT